MQATSDKTASANFTQTGHSIALRYSAGNLTNGKTGYNPFFQWGRKDAFRSAENDLEPADGTTLVFKADSVTVGTSIQNPTVYYNSRYLSYDPTYNNAWNATYTEFAGTSTDNIDGLEKTVKTVYDPCPVGYTVAPGNAFYGFNTSNFTVDGDSRYYTSNGKKLYFHFVGRRNYGEGRLSNIGTEGCCWTAVGGKSAVEGRALLFTSAWIRIDNSPARSWGRSIRPVREN